MQENTNKYATSTLALKNWCFHPFFSPFDMHFYLLVWMTFAHWIQSSIPHSWSLEWRGFFHFSRQQVGTTSGSSLSRRRQGWRFSFQFSFVILRRRWEPHSHSLSLLLNFFALFIILYKRQALEKKASKRRPFYFYSTASVIILDIVTNEGVRFCEFNIVYIFKNYF